MNILKRSRVLNRNCLREKIQSLSPLLRTFDFGPPNKDSVFKATWSYYASDCQERLSNIRRRIEQNARIMAPKKGPLSMDLELPFNESQLPPGLDWDEHIYQELMSCFRNAESTESIKKTPVKRSKVQRSFDMGKFSTPEQWISWKREEQQVHQLLKKSYDPYLKEEMSKKLEHLQKLAKRRPLVVLPNQEETIEKPKKSLPKKRKLRQKYKNKSKSEIHHAIKNNTKMEDKYKTSMISTNIPTNLAVINSRKDLSKSETENNYSINSRNNANHLADIYKPSSASLIKKGSTKIEDNYKTSLNSKNSIKNISVIPSRKNLLKSASKSKFTSANLTMSRFFAEHPSLESIPSSRRSTYTIRPIRRRIQKTSESSDEEDGIYGIDDERDSPLLELKRIKSITSQIIQKDRNSKTSTTMKKRKTKYRKPQELKKMLYLKDYEGSNDMPSLSEPLQNNSEVNSKNENMTIAENPKSEETLQIDEIQLFKISKGEQNTEERRQSFISKGKSPSSTKFRSASHQYIHEMLKGLNKSNTSLFGGFKDKNSSSILSLYRGQIANQKKKSVNSGGWSINIKPHSIVKPMAPKNFIFKKKALPEKVLKSDEFEPPENPENQSVRGTILDLLHKKTPESLFRSKNDSEDEMHLNIESKPIVIADIISQFLDSYGSEISFNQSYPDLFKSNVYEQFSVMSVIDKEKPKEKKKREVKKVIEVKKMPSKHIVCSLCNLVRRRQSELRPYMQRMQKQRQRLEQKTYYAQNLSKCRRDPKQCALEKEKRAHIRKVLTKCYKALDLCHQIVEQKILKKSEGC
ncbi:uncharacterized protein LOC119549165 [Drosophila subpulchrella]|uniref:uncharacterized protein LOC119549165 n=1 Tax=Drosophila subpulchrella TaxID=1486046 RepID=UPI0018A133BE|nr:uncharacterized protein LOC119549165 [Drosophila subpulchrella]